MKPTMILAAALFGFVATASAAETISVENAWARASAGGGTAAFFTIRNTGDSADKLVAVATEAAKETSLHTTVKDGDTMKMRPVDGIEVPAHGSVDLAPGGYHVMLMGLSAPLKAGDTLPLSLTFQKAGTLAVSASVQKIGAMGPMMDHNQMMMMDHSHMMDHPQQ